MLFNNLSVVSTQNRQAVLHLTITLLQDGAPGSSQKKGAKALKKIAPERIDPVEFDTDQDLAVAVEVGLGQKLKPFLEQLLKSLKLHWSCSTTETLLHKLAVKRGREYNLGKGTM